jgi:predicted RNase H-like nuclease (RuvC/YqgF family)
MANALLARSERIERNLENIKNEVPEYRAELARVLAAVEVLREETNLKISALTKENTELKEHIAKQDNKIAEQDKRIAEQDKKITEQADEIAELKKTVKYLEEKSYASTMRNFLQKFLRAVSPLNTLQIFCSRINLATHQVLSKALGVTEDMRNTSAGVLLNMVKEREEAYKTYVVNKNLPSYQQLIVIAGQILTAGNAAVHNSKMQEIFNVVSCVEEPAIFEQMWNFLAEQTQKWKKWSELAEKQQDN